MRRMSTARHEFRRRLTATRSSFATPLVRNAYSLVGSTLATSALGVVFWVVAARTFSASAVGTDSAIITTMALLTNIASLNLANGFNRFVPTAGHKARRLVLVGYALTVTLSGVAAIVFLAGAPLWAPGLAFIRDSRPEAVWFIVATMIWTVFVLEDAVLTGLGEAHWVLIENAIYGVLKLIALVGIAAAMTRFGIFTAWTLPLVLLVIPVNLLLFGRLIPARKHPPIEDIAPRRIARLVGVDYLSILLTTATLGFVPLLVLAINGARANAYVALAWTIAYPLHLLSVNVGMAMITEASREQHRLVEYTRRTALHALRIVVPLVVVGIVAAPLVLRVFGPAYASHSVVPFQLFALAAIPNVVISTYVSVARVQRKMWQVVGVTFVQSVIILGACVILLPSIGIDGVGYAWVLATGTVALVLLLGPLRFVWTPYLRRMSARPPLESVLRESASTAKPDRERACDAIEMSGLESQGWTRAGVAAVCDGVQNVVVTNGGRRALLRVALDDDGIAALTREVAAIESTRLAVTGEVRNLLPEIIDADMTTRRVWALEQRPSSTDGRYALKDPRSLSALFGDAVERLRDLYVQTSTTVTVDGRLFGRLVEGPLAAACTLPVEQHRLGSPAGLGRTHRDLADSLVGREMTTARTHGNLWLGALRWDQASASLRCITDWRQSLMQPPVVDVAHLLCTTRALRERRELGDVVRNVLDTGCWPAADEAILAATPGADELDARTVVLMMWLRHVCDQTNRGNRFGTRDVWRTHDAQSAVEYL